MVPLDTPGQDFDLLGFLGLVYGAGRSCLIKKRQKCRDTVHLKGKASTNFMKKFAKNCQTSGFEKAVNMGRSTETLLRLHKWLSEFFNPIGIELENTS